MIDAELRPYITKSLTGLAKKMTERGFDANMVTLIGAGMAIPAFVSLATGFYPAALFFILLNRFCDGLDGVVATHQKGGPTLFGKYLDEICDLFFYVGIVFFFTLGRPEALIPGAFLMFGIMGTIITPVIFRAILSGSTTHDVAKVLRHVPGSGLAEGFETTLVLVLMCLFPWAFGVIAVIYGMVCWAVLVIQFFQARKELTSPGE